MMYLIQYKEKGKDWQDCCRLSDEDSRKFLLDTLQELDLDVREIPDIPTVIRVI